MIRPPSQRASLLGAAIACLVAAGGCSSAASSSGSCRGADCGPALLDGGSDAGNADTQGDAGSDSDGGDEDARGDTEPDSGSPDVPDGGDVDAGDADTDGGEDDSGPCGGAESNWCGGCFDLPRVVGAPCGECGDGAWECDGTDSVRCAGATLAPRDWWFDFDGDGFGDHASLPYRACTSPAPNWVDNAGDCDDRQATVNPDATEVCDRRDQNCDGVADDPPEGCFDACCDETRVCEEGRCLIACEGTRCGATDELCCGSGELCYADSCAPIGEECAFTEDCDLDEICEPLLEICLPRSVVPPCEYRPPVGVFEPRLGCRWTPAGLSVNPSHRDVVATPIVINLTDDDGDGVTDENDTPEIVFLTYDLGGGCCNVAATIRIVSGQCNPDGTMRTLASLAAPALTNDAGLAAGDLDGDGVPEILAVTRSGSNPQGTVAFKRAADDGSAWTVLWHNTTYPTWNAHTRGGPLISIANLDAAGAPEVIIGNVVLDGLDGSLLWDGRVTSGGTGGVGNNAFLGPASAVADVDLDGLLEVFAGNTLYEHDGTVAWTYPYTTSNSTCQGSLPCDGFNAVGNFDDDPYAELVAVRLGEVFVWEHTGELIWQAQIPKIDCSRNESGPPTVADFDGDGYPEIGTASADYYVVLDRNDCDTPDFAARGCSDRNILWKVANEDCSSRATGSSVFDFEGDGRAEVIYADETNFRIYDGRTGAILFDDATHGSHTRIEMPVIADVDNDGNAEIVIPENGSNGGTPGLEVWEDASDNWVRTRRVWNQHGYSVTNIREDGSVPRVPEINWQNPRLNNYRQNTQPAGIFDAPDLAIRSLGLIADTCPLTTFRVVVRVANDGALSVPPGVPIRVFVESGDRTFGLDTVHTTRRLFPGDTELIAFDATITGEVPPPPYTVRATVDPDETINECNDDNNSRSSADFDCYPRR